jgi:hypothetical protein
MRLKIAKRIYTTKISTLIFRPILNEKYQFEFMKRMTNSEIKRFLDEVKNQLKVEGISTKNISYYNAVYRDLLNDREEIFLLFKEIGSDGFVDDSEDVEYYQQQCIAD